MKKLILLLMLCCMCTGCTIKEEKEVVYDKSEEAVEEAAVPEDDMTEEETKEEQGIEGTKIMPLPATIDMNDLNNCTLSVSFEKGDAYVDDTGAMQLDVTVYTYDLYDMVDISNLKEGDIIVICGKEVLVDTMETLESGLLFINGGMENGGYDLWHNDSGVYFEHGYNDAKSYYPIGKASIRVSADFEFADSSDLDKGEVIYYPGDFLTDTTEIVYDFTPNNTSIVVEEGQIVRMIRVYIP